MEADAEVLSAVASAAAGAHSPEDPYPLVETHTRAGKAVTDLYSMAQEALGLRDGHLAEERRDQRDLADSHMKAAVQVDD